MDIAIVAGSLRSIQIVERPRPGRRATRPRRVETVGMGHLEIPRATAEGRGS